MDAGVRRLDQLELAGKRVLVRVDFNVPLDEHRNVTSDARIRASLPTIEHVVRQGGKAILLAHLGRPKGGPDEQLRLGPVALRLRQLTKATVGYCKECVGPLAQKAVAATPFGEILVLENLRFHPEEERGDAEFAKQLALLGDVYVNDAFGAAHRAHASITGIPALLPHAAGLLLQQEIDAFQRVLEQPARPFVAVLGGAKVSDKLPVIQNLLAKVDALLIGGAMAYTFLAQRGFDIGKSRCEKDLLGEAQTVTGLAAQRQVKLLLPVDHLCAADLKSGATPSLHADAIPKDLMGLDIGPKSIELFRGALLGARTIVWNGPMGVFENPAFAEGTIGVARALAEATRRGAFTVVGGGDSVAAIEQCKLEREVSHVSTGGGASLELLEGQTLPGIAALA